MEALGTQVGGDHYKNYLTQDQWRIENRRIIDGGVV